MSGLWQRLMRMRAGLGFGVHSPLAYSLIRTTFRERAAYYAYPRVDAMFHTPRDHYRARMLFRIAVRFRPDFIVADNGLSDVWTRVCALACPKAIVTERSLVPPGANALYITDRERFTPPADAVTVYINVAPRSLGKSPRILPVEERRGPLLITNCRDMAVAVTHAGISPTLVEANF